MSDDQPNEPAERQANRTRGGDGRYIRTPETAERDAQAAHLRAKGWSYRRIAAEMDYSTPSSVFEAVQRALDAIPAEPAEDVKRFELERLDAMYAAAMEVLERRHVHVSGGKVVLQITEYARDDDGNILLDDDGRPMAAKVEQLEDDAPVLAAIDRLLKIQARRAALLGLDAERKVDAGIKITYDIPGVDLSQL